MKRQLTGPAIESSQFAMGFRNRLRMDGETLGMWTYKDGNQVMAVICVIGASDIRRVDAAIFSPMTRRQQQKAETRRVNKRLRKILLRAAKRAAAAGKNGAARREKLQRQPADKS
jgi:hypothetical protein